MVEWGMWPFVHTLANRRICWLFLEGVVVVSHFPGTTLGNFCSFIYLDSKPLYETCTIIIPILWVVQQCGEVRCGPQQRGLPHQSSWLRWSFCTLFSSCWNENLAERLPWVLILLPVSRGSTVHGDAESLSHSTEETFRQHSVTAY